MDSISVGNGFGYATERIIATLTLLGYTVEQHLAEPDVEFWFDQPQWIRWEHPEAYKIAYVPWESTGLPDGWLDKLNSADEVWTPSPIVAEWFVKAGVNVPVHVYLHGVDKLWTPLKRSLEGPFRLFHHGGEAVRKGWSESAKMFVEHFAGRDAEINFKMQLPGWDVPVPKVNIIQHKVPIEDLVELYHKQNLMVYPSWGEGFGLTPLQAMATGMPVLITRGWAPYEHLLPQECLIDSELVDSPWPSVHPGKMLKPDYDDMCRKALHIYENYEEYALNAFEKADETSARFNWLWHTYSSFLLLEKRLKSVAL